MDFRKLLEMSPQEREATRVAAQDAYERRCEETLAARQVQLAAALALPDLRPRERDFLAGLERCATRLDHVVGRMGGELLYISDDQSRWLQDIAARAKPRPAEGSDVFARMAAFGTRRSPRGSVVADVGPEDPARPRG